MRTTVALAGSGLKALVCGSRSWTDPEPIRSWLAKLQDWGYDTIIEGEARGADSIAAAEAIKMGFTVIRCPAKWSQFGKAAGFIRNAEMLTHKPDIVIAFHEDLSKSKGTAHMVKLARDVGMEVIVVEG